MIKATRQMQKYFFRNLNFGLTIVENVYTGIFQGECIFYELI